MSTDSTDYTAPPTKAELLALAPYPSILIDGERMLAMLGIQQSPGRLVQTAEDMLDELGEEFGSFHITRHADGKPDTIGLSVEQFVRICAHYGYAAAGLLRDLIGAQLEVKAGDDVLRLKIRSYVAAIGTRTKTEIRVRFNGIPLSILNSTLEQMVLSGEFKREFIQRGQRGPHTECYTLKGQR